MLEQFAKEGFIIYDSFSGLYESLNSSFAKLMTDGGVPQWIIDLVPEYWQNFTLGYFILGSGVTIIIVASLAKWVIGIK